MGPATRWEACRDLDNVTNAYRELCAGYLVKPISRESWLVYSWNSTF
jgi:hypothetical protein